MQSPPSIKPSQSESKNDQDDLDDEKIAKHLSQKEEAEAEFDYMNDVEARQKRLVEKHQQAKKKEEHGDDFEDEKPIVANPEPKSLTEKASGISDIPMQKVPSIFVDSPPAPVVKPPTPAPAPQAPTQAP